MQACMYQYHVRCAELESARRQAKCSTGTSQHHTRHLVFPGSSQGRARVAHRVYPDLPGPPPALANLGEELQSADSRGNSLMQE